MDIRRLNEYEIEQAIKLADKTFRIEGQTSMGVAYPHIFSAGIVHSFGAFDEKMLVSFIGLVPSKIHIGAAVLNVFSIGSVCTHEDYRKKGISSAILQEIYQYIDKAGASLLFVSGDRGMYMRNHCYHYGLTYKYSVTQSNAVKNNYEGSVRKGKASDIFQIDHLRREKDVRFESSLWEWSTLLKSSGYASNSKMQQVLFVAEHQGTIKGYIVIGLPNEKNSKQRAVVIEWAGKPKTVHSILLDILANDLATEIVVNIPWHERYHEEFSKYPSKQLTQGGTIYLIDPERLINQAKPYLLEKTPDLVKDLEIISKKNDTFQLTLGQSNLLLTRKELVEFLFNVKERGTTNKWQRLFPLLLPNPDGMYYV